MYILKYNRNNEGFWKENKMGIWKTDCCLEELNKAHKNSMVDHLGMKITEVGEDYLKMVMPIDSRTKQLFGIMHGGASAALAESAGSIAANLCINPATHIAVGLDINTSHIRQVRSGSVMGIAEPVHIGRSTHIWQIKIFDENANLVSLSRLTMAVLEKIVPAS